MNPLKKDSSSKPGRITCRHCGRLYKAQPECPKCGQRHPPDDPSLDSFTRLRLSQKLAAEKRQIARLPIEAQRIWAGSSRARLNVLAELARTDN